MRSYHRQRATWHREALVAGKKCVCCKCGDKDFLQASKSAGTMRAYLHRPCGKRSEPLLTIDEGPNSTEQVTFYRRQCCRVPLPELKDVNMLLMQASAAAAAAVANPADVACAAEAARLKAACEKSALQLGYSVDDVMECQDCKLCGWAACMPVCPVEWDETKPATIKAYVPVLQSNGVSVQSELQEQATTRKGLMQHMEAAFAVADAHLFIDEWTTHHRQLVYSFTITLARVESFTAVQQLYIMFI